MDINGVDFKPGAMPSGEYGTYIVKYAVGGNNKNVKIEILNYHDEVSSNDNDFMFESMGTIEHTIINTKHILGHCFLM